MTIYLHLLLEVIQISWLPLNLITKSLVLVVSYLFVAREHESLSWFHIDLDLLAVGRSIVDVVCHREFVSHTGRGWHIYVHKERDVFNSHSWEIHCCCGVGYVLTCRFPAKKNYQSCSK